MRYGLSFSLLSLLAKIAHRLLFQENRQKRSIVKGISLYKERCHVSLLVDRGVKVVVREKETLKMVERGQ